MENILQLLKTDAEKGLSCFDLEDRTAAFGNNYREPLKVKSFFLILKEAMDDFMIKVLLVCAVFSIIFDMLLADPHERSHGKCNSTPLVGARTARPQNKINYKCSLD